MTVQLLNGVLHKVGVVTAILLTTVSFIKLQLIMVVRIVPGIKMHKIINAQIYNVLKIK